MADQAAVQPADVASHSYDHTERVGFGIFMIVAPLVVLAATIIVREPKKRMPDLTSGPSERSATVPTPPRSVLELHSSFPPFHGQKESKTAPRYHRGS